MEDLVTGPPFQAFSTWSIQQHRGEIGPHILSRFGVITQRAGLHEQSGAAAHKSSLPPLVPFGVGPDGHFRCALDIPRQALELPALDSDLKFAAVSIFGRTCLST